MSRTNYNCLSFMAIKCLHKFTLRRRWRGGRARFLHFELAKLEGQGDPLLGESFEFFL